MHVHEHDLVDGDSLRPKGARLTEPGDGMALRAALSGRLDAAGSKGMLDLQRAVGNSAATAAVQADAEEQSPVHDVIASPGAPLDKDVRQDMEGRLGHDFSDVRVHTDSAAEASAKSVGAHAYTVGTHIAFQRSAYDPSSTAGRTTLAHELTHVVQQRNGPVDGTPAAGGVSVSDPSDRFEREAAANADRVMSAQAPVQTAAVGAAGAQLQREEMAEEEEPVQGSFVQREEEAAPEEEPAG
jgi:hypothetical protein